MFDDSKVFLWIWITNGLNSPKKGEKHYSTGCTAFQSVIPEFQLKITFSHSFFEFQCLFQKCCYLAPT